jgi:hypothetical protein
MSVLTGGRARWAVLGAIVGALAVGGIAWADIPDSGVIHGCYKTVGGSLRVVDASRGEECKSGEKSLPWNQTGPTGPSGAAGPTTLVQGSFQVINLTTMLTHTVTADEAGLNVVIATVELADRDPFAGGPTSVGCQINGLPGQGPGDVATLVDTGDTFDGDRKSFTLIGRGTVADTNHAKQRAVR